MPPLFLLSVPAFVRMHRTGAHGQMQARSRSPYSDCALRQRCARRTRRRRRDLHRRRRSLHCAAAQSLLTRARHPRPHWLGVTHAGQLDGAPGAAPPSESAALSLSPAPPLAGGWGGDCTQGGLGMLALPAFAHAVQIGRQTTCGNVTASVPGRIDEDKHPDPRSRLP